MAADAVVRSLRPLLARRRCLFTPASQCVPEFRTGAEVHQQPEKECSVLYTCGGLYGNVSALEAFGEVVRKDETKQKAVIFNGDFNFLNASRDLWLRLNNNVRDFGAASGSEAAASKGNIECELLKPRDAIIGCGCAYPPHVDPGVSERSSEIVRLLHQRAHETDDTATFNWLETLPLTTTYKVGNKKIAVVHGDPDCLNGWSLAHDADTLNDNEKLKAYFQRGNFDILASTHTCVAHMATVDQNYVIANNGATGMANFKGSRYGLVTRIAAPQASPSPVEPAYGVILQDGTRVDHIPIHFDVDAWFKAHFEPLWGPDSPAAISYANRINHGLSSWTHQDAYARVHPSLLSLPTSA